jgi:4-hydroxy-tetrahydrodipicolinate synthase
MTTPARPWHGVLVATALPLRPTGPDGSLAPDLDAYAEHVSWLAHNGCDGIVPNGSLGEYQTLTADERAAVVRTAVDAAGGRITVMPGVAAYGAAESRRWAEQAGEAGASCVMLLPPNAYRADERAVVEHYREVAKAGLPIVAYNNPFDTKVDLTPTLLARLFGEGLIVAVKEFSGDVRRAYEIAELAPGLDLLVGSDDVTLELALAGAVGWVAGYPNALPGRVRRAVARRRAPTWPQRSAVPVAAPAAALGLRARSSSRRSSCRWTSPAGTAALPPARAVPAPRAGGAGPRGDQKVLAEGLR